MKKGGKAEPPARKQCGGCFGLLAEQEPGTIHKRHIVHDNRDCKRKVDQALKRIREKKSEQKLAQQTSTTTAATA